MFNLDFNTCLNSNYVKTELKNDYAYMAASGSTLNANSENNKVCNLSNAAIICHNDELSSSLS